MFVLIKAAYGYLDDNNEVKAFATLLEAERAMEHDANEVLNDMGLALESSTIGELIENGFSYGYRRPRYCEIYDGPDGSLSYIWIVLEVEDIPSKPHMNPNAAETVSYECKTEPTFRSREVLMHQATVRWNSGKSFKCHAPERIELRVGGTAYEYKAI